MSTRKLMIPGLKDILIFVAWIAGLLLAGGLCWSLTRSVRSDFLLNSINRALSGMGDYRRLEAPIAPGAFRSDRTIGPISRQGSWFSLDGEADRLLFFTLMADGTFFPCAAIVNPQGRVKEIISLSSRGEKTLSHVSPGIIRLYIRRIEGKP